VHAIVSLNLLNNKELRFIIIPVSSIGTNFCPNIYFKLITKKN